MPKVSVIVPVYNVEKYIYDMLKSVQAQTLGDFEVLLINDGSTDGSQQIIDGFCASDERFQCVYQENAGVSAARNRGIELAKGEYIVFYDPDDYIPQAALEKMYNAGASRQADLIVGVMEEHNMGRPMIYMHSKMLARQKEISATDKNFLGAWSTCNKMFSTELLKRNNLWFENLINAEDGVFSFCVLNCAEKIVGCNEVSYNYIRRPFWLSPSATQIINESYFKGLTDSHDRILEECRKLSAKIADKDEAEKYIQEIYLRCLEKDIINYYYRLIWKADKNFNHLIAERAAEYRKHITQDQWQTIVKAHKDLELEKGFLPEEYFAENPIISIIVRDDIDEGTLNIMVGSLYNQLFPRFEVILAEKCAAKVDEVFLNKANCIVLKDDDYLQNAVKTAKGRYMMYLDEFVIFTKNSLRTMAETLDKNCELEFVSILMRNIKGEEYSPIPVLSAAFGYGRDSGKYNRFLACDNIMSNKLFKRGTFETIDFTQDAAVETDRLYKNAKYKTLRKDSVIAEFDEDYLTERAIQPPLKKSVARAFRNQQRVAKAIGFAKKYVTKKDINKVLKIVGK